MIVALYILLAIVVTGAILYVLHRCDIARESTSEQQQDEAAEATAQNEQSEAAECCGMHITCERDSLLSSVSYSIEYYDDEELDRFRGRSSDGYSDDEIEEFRSVLLTLLPHDIAGWGRSIQLRGIELPAAVRDELLLIVSEARMKLTETIE